MTANEPQLPTVPFDPTPCPQRWAVGESIGVDGETKLINVMILQPMTSTVLALTHESARALADQLFSLANGLHVARDLGDLPPQ